MSVIIKVQKPKATRAQVGLWLRKYYRVSLSLAETMGLAEDMVSGVALTAQNGELNGMTIDSTGIMRYEFLTNDSGLMSYEFVEDADPWQEARKRQQAEQQSYFDLRDRGAAGDAEAAIEYCRLEQEYKVSHAAMG